MERFCYCSCNEFHHVPGMPKTRSMSRKQNDDASASRSFKTSGSGGSAPWSCLSYDVLLLVMMQLGIIDFIAFSGVCKSWRSLALSTRNMFMASKRPLLMWLSDNDTKDCHFKDLEGRRFRTVLPNGTGRTLIGLTCGYLIMYNRRTKDFWLVNPITRHELHFPAYPFYVAAEPAFIKATLVFSPSMSGWVLVVSRRCFPDISYCLAGEHARWNHVTCAFDILEIHAFKGHIYAISSENYLCELRLNLKPAFTVLKIENLMELDRLFPLEFVSTGDNLLLVGRVSTHLFVYLELDFEKSKCVFTQNKTKDYGLFVSELKGGGAVKPEVLRGDPRYGRVVRTIGTRGMWYFPHDCFNVNLLEE